MTTSALARVAPLFLTVSEADAKSAGGTAGFPKGWASPLPPKGFRWEGPTGPEEIQAAYAAGGLAQAIRAWAQGHWARTDHGATIIFRLWAMAPAIASAVSRAPQARAVIETAIGLRTDNPVFLPDLEWGSQDPHGRVFVTSRAAYIAAPSREPRRITLWIDGIQVVAQRHHLGGAVPGAWGRGTHGGVGIFVMLSRAEAREVSRWQLVLERAKTIQDCPRAYSWAPALPPVLARPAPFEGQAKALPARARRAGNLSFELAAY